MTDTTSKRPEILIVDDILANRLILNDIATAIGCKCTAARNGEEAISVAQERHFDMILMDVEMPVMNGLEATTAIRTNIGPNTQTPIIALTAHTKDEITDELATSGFSDIMEKPFVFSKIKTMVGRYCHI